MNPLVQREFFGILRRPRAAAMLVALTAAFALVVLLRWPSDAIVDLSGARSRQVFQVFVYTLFAGVLFLVPAYPATSFVGERVKGTLALLLNSPLSPWSIYLGKLVGVLLYAFLLLFTSLPAASACYAMGGIDLIHELGTAYAVLAALTVQLAVLGLLVSTYAQSVDSGVRVAYAATLGLCFLTLGPHYFYQGQGGLLSWLAEQLRQFSAVPILVRLAGHADVGEQGLLSVPRGAVEFFCLSAAMVVGLSVLTVSRLNYRLFDRSRPKGVITDERSLSGRVSRRIVFLIDPQRRKAGIPWYVNPVMVKEFRTRRFGRFHWLVRLVAACAVISLLLTLAATLSTMDWGVATIGGLMVLLQVVLVVLITPSLAAGLISGERESGGWDLLRMTPLSGFAILRGKLQSVAWTLLFVLLSTLPGYLVMLYIEPGMWLQVYQVMICLLLATLLTLMISVVISSLCVRTAVATATGYIVLITLFLGPLLIWLAREQPFGRSVVETALLANPMGAALAVLEVPGFQTYELLPASWWIAGIVSFLLFGFLCLRTWRLTRQL